MNKKIFGVLLIVVSSLLMNGAIADDDDDDDDRDDDRTFTIVGVGECEGVPDGLSALTCNAYCHTKPERRDLNCLDEENASFFCPWIKKIYLKKNPGETMLPCEVVPTSCLCDSTTFPGGTAADILEQLCPVETGTRAPGAIFRCESVAQPTRCEVRGDGSPFDNEAYGVDSNFRGQAVCRIRIPTGSGFPPPQDQFTKILPSVEDAEECFDHLRARCGD